MGFKTRNLDLPVRENISISGLLCFSINSLGKSLKQRAQFNAYFIVLT